MHPQILQNFHHRLLPIFQPRTERYLQALTPESLASVPFRYIFSVPAMLQISHLIEFLITRNPQVSDFHVCFQYFSRFKSQKVRYREVAEAARGLWLYGVEDTPPPALPRTTIVNIETLPIVDYWFLVAYGPGFYQTLLAEEIQTEPGLPRTYEGFYTFDPGIAYQMLSLLHQTFPQQVAMPLLPEQLQG
jgi:hypothetical protein